MMVTPTNAGLSLLLLLLGLACTGCAADDDDASPTTPPPAEPTRNPETVAKNKQTFMARCAAGYSSAQCQTWLKGLLHPKNDNMLQSIYPTDKELEQGQYQHPELKLYTWTQIGFLRENCEDQFYGEGKTEFVCNNKAGKHYDLKLCLFDALQARFGLVDAPPTTAASGGPTTDNSLLKYAAIVGGLCLLLVILCILIYIFCCCLGAGVVITAHHGRRRGGTGTGGGSRSTKGSARKKWGSKKKSTRKSVKSRKSSKKSTKSRKSKGKNGGGPTAGGARPKPKKPSVSIKLPEKYVPKKSK